MYTEEYMAGYEVTEKDIEGMLKYLHIFHPDNANRDFAIEFLKYWKTVYRRIGSTDPDALDKLYEAFEQSRSKE
jgi:hypothetical protein